MSNWYNFCISVVNEPNFLKKCFRVQYALTYLQIIKTLSLIKSEILDLNILSVYGHGAWPYWSHKEIHHFFHWKLSSLLLNIDQFNKIYSYLTQGLGVFDVILWTLLCTCTCSRSFSLRFTICELRSKLIVNLRAARGTLRFSAILRTIMKNYSVFLLKCIT